MKKVMLILSLVSFSVNVFSQGDCDIKKEYKNIFKISKQIYNERVFLNKTVNQIGPNTCFSDLINNNEMYIDYLLTHFSDKSNYNALKGIEDTLKMQQTFIKFLEEDSLFNSVMFQLTEKITHKTSYIPDTISINQLLDVAVKFFYIRKITPQGYYSGKVCTGINGLKQTQKKRQPQLEAFCLVTIMQHYQGEKYSLYNEFVKGIQELYKLNLGLDTEERLLRAQGAMYMFMRNNKVLKELLMMEYENKKEYLLFC